MSMLEGMTTAQLGRCNLALAVLLTGAFAGLSLMLSGQSSLPLWPWVLVGASPFIAGIRQVRPSGKSPEEQSRQSSNVPPDTSRRPPLHTGTHLCDGMYEIGEMMGRGGFGITYSGRDLLLGRRVAIKECFPAGCQRLGNSSICATGRVQDDLRRKLEEFREEGRLLAHLETFRHRGLVEVHAAFEENGTAYIVMESIDGKTLTELVKKGGAPLPEIEAVAYLQQVAEALSMVHSVGYVHLDVKPDNVMVTPSGRAVLIDFGNARRLPLVELTGREVALTPGFAPLEQYREKAARGPFSDVYGLAATLYYTLCAEPPPAAPERTSGDSLPGLQDVNRVSPRVAEAIERGMAVEAERRHRTVQNLVDALYAPAATWHAPSRCTDPSTSEARPWLDSLSREATAKSSMIASHARA